MSIGAEVRSNAAEVKDAELRSAAQTRASGPTWPVPMQAGLTRLDYVLMPTACG